MRGCVMIQTYRPVGRAISVVLEYSVRGWRTASGLAATCIEPGPDARHVLVVEVVGEVDVDERGAVEPRDSVGVGQLRFGHRPERGDQAIVRGVRCVVFGLIQ